MAAAALYAAPASAQSPKSSVPAPAASDHPIVVRAEGGVVLCCAATGFLAGANIAATPRALDGLEVAGDATVGRFGGFSILYFAADALYPVSVGTFRPYVGGGLGVVKTSGGGPTNAGAQIVAGIQLPSAGRHLVRVEARFLFLPAETTFLLGSISF